MRAAAKNIKTSMADVVLMVVAVVIGAAVTAAIVIGSSRAIDRSRNNAPSPSEQPLPAGVTARFILNGMIVERELEVLDLPNEFDESLADAFREVSFEGELNVRFDPGDVRYARIGAILQNGSIIIMRNDEVLLSDFASSDREKVVLTLTPIRLVRRTESVKYIFRSDGGPQTKLQAIWQPEGVDQPLTLK